MEEKPKDYPQADDHDQESFKCIIAELENLYRPHSIILYGSRANGTASSSSDLDLALFSDTVDKPMRDARFTESYFLDAFVYPTSSLEKIDESMLRLRRGKIIKDSINVCQKFIEAINQLYLQGPPPLTPDEIQVKKTWPIKMCERAKAQDVEGNFRRAWLLTALLEDFFVVRGEWYLGPKESLKALEDKYPDLFSLYSQALKADASIRDLEILVGKMLIFYPK